LCAEKAPGQELPSVEQQSARELVGPCRMHPRSLDFTDRLRAPGPTDRSGVRKAIRAALGHAR